MKSAFTIYQVLKKSIDLNNAILLTISSPNAPTPKSIRGKVSEKMMPILRAWPLERYIIHHEVTEGKRKPMLPIPPLSAAQIFWSYTTSPELTELEIRNENLRIAVT